MRKINLLFLTLMLIFASGMYAQDVVYNDFDRAGWVPKAPAYSPIDKAPGIDGKVAGAEYLIDDNTRTFLALVKPDRPGKTPPATTYEGVTGPATIEELGFTINMPEAKVFDYFRISFNSGNQYHYLRPWEVSIYGSNDAGADFTTGTWTLITDKSGNNKITIQEEVNPGDPGKGTGAPYVTGNIDLDNTVAYSSIKVVYKGMSSNPTSGSTLQVAEFYVGKTTNDRVIEKSADISFGDVMQDNVAEKTLGIKGYNLNNPLSYTLKGDDAAAFSVTPVAGAASSTGDTVTIKFSPTARKLYTADLIINMTGVVEPDTIVLTGNADFNLPVQISSVSEEHWYYIQFERQAAAGKVLTNPATAGSLIEQSILVPGNNDQLWKVTGTWDNYKVVNKAGQELTYKYEPAKENPTTGEVDPEVNNYITTTTGDAFGFVRYNTTDSWQLNNISSTIIPAANKKYLFDESGEYVGGGALNNAGTQLKFIPSDVPSFVIPGDTVSLGAVRKNTSEDFAVAIGGLNLTGNITVTLTNDADQVYNLKTSSLPATGGMVEVTFAPVAYKKTSYATITLTNSILTESFVVSATSDVGISKYYVYTGETSPWGTRNDGEIVSAIPALKVEDEVWIAAGEYTVAQISVPASVAIYGGFSGTETSVDQRTMVAGGKPWEFTNPTVLKNTATLVLSVTGASTIVDGITFEGAATGRAIQNTTASATDGIVRNSIMKNFNSGADGGAMNVRYKTEIYNCLITNNTGNKGGGGYLDNVIIHDCEITHNSVPTTAVNSIGNVNGGGGGLLLVNCEAYNLYVANNTASYGGGLFPRTTTKVYNSIIVENTAKGGGGISFDERDSGTMIYNVTIANNKSTEQGGIAGVNFAANTESRSAKLYNSILWNNTEPDDEIYNIGRSGIVDAVPEIKNTIIDDIQYYQGENPTFVIADCIIEADGTKLFVADSWLTAESSPGINKGFIQLTEEVTDPDTGDIITEATYLEFATGKDYAGNPRIFETIDIGPYEYNVFSSIVNPDSDIEGNVIDIKYYNIQGIEVTVPVANNVYIKKEVFDTGKVRATKVLYTNTYIKL